MVFSTVDLSAKKITSVERLIKVLLAHLFAETHMILYGSASKI